MTGDEEIYSEMDRDLIRYATVLVGPSHAEDVVSAVVTRTLARGGLSELENPRTYLMRAVLNESKNHRRGNARQASALARVGRPDPMPAAEEGRYPDVTRAVMNLPVQQRAAVYLVHWVGMTPTEAATHLGCRPATLRRYLHLARRKLRGFLDA